MEARFIPIRKIAALAAFFYSAPAFSCTTTYFESINEKDIPVKPFQRISSAEAAKRESDGRNYFIKKDCPEDGSLTVIRRQEKKDYDVFYYKMELGKVVSYRITNSEGKVISGGL